MKKLDSVNDIKMQITIEAFQVLEKTVKLGGTSGRVYVPYDWIGKKAKIRRRRI